MDNSSEVKKLLMFSTFYEQKSSAKNVSIYLQVVTKIASLYAERLMSDLILVVGKQELPAHRLILCASSEVFQVGCWLLVVGCWLLVVGKQELPAHRLILCASSEVFQVLLSMSYYDLIHYYLYSISYLYLDMSYE